jgi:hypothetical protein
MSKGKKTNPDPNTDVSNPDVSNPDVSNPDVSNPPVSLPPVLSPVDDAMEAAFYGYLSALTKPLYPLVHRALLGDPPCAEEVKKIVQKTKVGDKNLWEIFCCRKKVVKLIK